MGSLMTEPMNYSVIFRLFYYKKWGMKFVFSQPPRSLIPYMGFLMNTGYHSLRQRDKETMLNQVAEEIAGEIEALAPNYVPSPLSHA